MTPGDVARILSACALYDYRVVEAHDAAAWFQVIGDLDADDAMEAVRRHYMESTDRAMPAHIRQIAKTIRAERLRRERRSDALALPSKFEQDMGRQVRMAKGGATIAAVLKPLLEHLAAQRKELPAAAQETLRAITAGPAWTGDNGEESR